MANLKDIKNRILSVESTKKITRAMKMVAAAKVKKSETAVVTSRPYTRELVSMFQKLLNSVTEFSSDSLKIKSAIDDYPALLKTREIKSIGILVMTSNKGLAGAYNANVVREVLRRIKEYQSNGISVTLFVAGQKGISALRKKCKELGVPIVKKYFSAIDNPNPMEARDIAEDMAEYFVAEKIDKIEIVTTRFKNMMSYFVEDWPVLPVVGITDVKERITDNMLDPLMEFIPDKHHILQKIVPMYMTNIFYQALLEAQASELASRMTAMSAATNNAEKMIKELSVEYNKTRQFAITQEIIEVVNGANSQLS
ncbi:MAG: ATP synthase F1 subunit gamma [Candidatus Gastranaerophilaceae bacterium]|jgi:F-type H+-transporting ATPase subunit gamma|nr:ATP synthase F1 subunit gamma [bacterium]MEE0495314.1 ATP synthase F1 subunit gamma [Cyanobacteriota bacterium]CDE91341.1 aTP synthase gamma chain [Fusobacterium sp. CAG:815]DAA93984.1 MAG TPA: ATP synthase F1 subunit gamma [Candidatus Gastranaerophilales bacterium HUM_7]DAA94061.1 MAG TPA: ATP synthase F1 subunit gamma [Candidatus Gastranaerophilales bacterium HUM_6]DAB04084.1 MAG TPA: ATP synthase F1 subunit gamma [Candidatus Gastranaerophilales bacterium HUM_12]DAB05293.1 MAG TPA: ATP s